MQNPRVRDDNCTYIICVSGIVVEDRDEEEGRKEGARIWVGDIHRRTTSSRVFSCEISRVRFT